MASKSLRIELRNDLAPSSVSLSLLSRISFEMRSEGMETGEMACVRERNRRRSRAKSACMDLNVLGSTEGWLDECKESKRVRKPQRPPSLLITRKSPALGSGMQDKRAEPAGSVKKQASHNQKQAISTFTVPVFC